MSVTHSVLTWMLLISFESSLKKQTNKKTNEHSRWKTHSVNCEKHKRMEKIALSLWDYAEDLHVKQQRWVFSCWQCEVFFFHQLLTKKITQLSKLSMFWMHSWKQQPIFRQMFDDSHSIFCVKKAKTISSWERGNILSDSCNMIMEEEFERMYATVKLEVG